MSAYQIIKIEFKTRKDRDKFENKFKYKRLFQYKDLTYECTYYLGWDGYDITRQIKEWLNKHIKLKNIKEYLSIDLTTNSSWWDELKDGSYEN